MVAATQQQPERQQPQHEHEQHEQHEAVMKRGEYNANAATQTKAAEIAMQLLVEAAENVPITPGTPVQVLELGCSEGVNSMQPVKTILRTLAGRMAVAKGTTDTTANGTTAIRVSAEGAGADEEAAEGRDANGHSQLRRLEVVVCHDDLPSNDFQPLLRLIADPQETYMPQDSRSPLAVFPSIIGRSCYERLRPDASVHLVFSFTTLHWLSKKPALGDELFPRQEQQQAPDKAAEQRAKQEAYDEQSRLDLTRVLELRAAEVIPGGMMQAHFVIRDSTPMTTWALQHLMAAVSDLVAAGKLTKAEVAAMAIPCHQRSEQLVGEVLEGVKEVWEAKRFFSKFVQSPPYTEWSAGNISAAEYAFATRKQRAAVFQGYMTAQLALTRGRAQAEALTDQLFDEFERRLAVAPTEEGMLMVYMLLQRTSAPAPSAQGLGTGV